MWAFSIVLILAIFAFSIILEILSEQQFILDVDTNSYGEHLQHMYLLMYGDFSVDEYSTS